MIWFPKNTDCPSVVSDQQHQRYLETCKNANYGPIPDLPNQKLRGGALQPVFYQVLHVVLTCPSCNWPKCWFECPILYSLVFQLQLIWSFYAWYHRYTTENTGRYVSPQYRLSSKHDYAGFHLVSLAITQLRMAGLPATCQILKKPSSYGYVFLFYCIYGVLYSSLC